MKKAQLRFDALLIGIIVFVAIVATGAYILEDINSSYDLNISTTEYANTQAMTEEMYNLSQQQKDSTLGTELETDDAADSMLKGGYSTLRAVKSTFGIVGNVLNETESEIGYPSYFKTLAIIAFTFAVIFGIVYLVMRYKP